MIKLWKLKNVVESTAQKQPSATESISSEKKEDEAVTPKEEKASSKSEEKAPKIESQASSQEKPLKEDVKAVTNEEVNQMIEDRKVNFNQIGTLNSMRILKKPLNRMQMYLRGKN